MKGRECKIVLKVSTKITHIILKITTFAYIRADDIKEHSAYTLSNYQKVKIEKIKTNE